MGHNGGQEKKFMLLCLTHHVLNYFIMFSLEIVFCFVFLTIWEQICDIKSCDILAFAKVTEWLTGKVEQDSS